MSDQSNPLGPPTPYKLSTRDFLVGMPIEVLTRAKRRKEIHASACHHTYHPYDWLNPFSGGLGTSPGPIGPMGGRLS